MIKVLKFGGTSVGSAGNMRRVADIISEQRATVTVLSAMSGTTDTLYEICCNACNGFDNEVIDKLITNLNIKYTSCIEDLLSVNKQIALKLKDKTLDILLKEARVYRDGDSEKIILSQGELLTSGIFTWFLQESGKKAVLLHAPDFIYTGHDGKPDAARLQTILGALVKDEDTLYITQGFICTNAYNDIDNLGRGGSDYSAALIGSALNADQVQIWTDIDGMHNNDPRYVEGTHPIRRMSFDEAAELAYFGAKILHPATIIPCKEKGIPVLLKNSMDPSAEGTLISDKDDPADDFHAVAAKDGITVLRIYSTRMLMAYGFLRKVFHVFEKHCTPIDMITTSEVAVSLTIDSDCHLEDILHGLSDLGHVEVEKENSIVCVVGKLDHGESGRAASILSGIGDIPVKMISYGASRRSLSLLVDTKHKGEVLRNLNKTIFSCDA